MQPKKDIFTSGSGHGGNIHRLSRIVGGKNRILDFSANINPLGPPEWLRRIISRELSQILHYPDPDCYGFVSAVAEKYGIPEECIVAANGTTELLYTLPRIVPCRRAVIPVPSYIDYEKVMAMHSIDVVHFLLQPDQDFQLDIKGLADVLEDGDCVILGTPNNPTGVPVAAQELVKLAQGHGKCWFVIDEAFLDFVEDGTSVSCRCENIITLNSLTKFYAIPGLRLGFGTFPQMLAEQVRTILPPWTVNSLAQSVGEKLLFDHGYAQHTLETLKTLRKTFLDQLSQFKELAIVPSSVNYFLIQLQNAMPAHLLADKLLERNIAIRVCSNYQGLDDSYFRIAVRTDQENGLLLDGLSTIFGKGRLPKPRKKKVNRSLMIQGTSSNAGKSIIVTALCRILIQDGLRVAPFKAQNMSLNSFVTHDGLEMGRAQVVQAQAARLDPDVRMNPILLKPNSDVGSQVIVEGKPVGNMSVGQYVQYKNQAGPKACKNYDQLAAEFDAVILEGAGSPGEVNLKHHDIVNMQMARYANSPVLLVGDIDRGGVYASFVGTMEVLEEWERTLVAGFLVNRFRGDASLLGPAHQYLTEHTGRDVIGVIPYISNLNIPEEDSVSFKEGKLQRVRPKSAHIEIALINLPHISNFTDIEPFLEEPDVFLKIIETVEDLRNAQAIILPGSKNVMADLEYLDSSGLTQAIVKKSTEGCEIVGICGGYQILGKTVADPHSIESSGETRTGLGLLDIHTSLAPDKTLIRRVGRHSQTDIDVFGYEIHHGISTGAVTPLLQFDDGNTCGALHPTLPIWGAYLHGIFDSDRFRRYFIDTLRKRCGMSPLSEIVAPYNLERAFDNLADIVRKSIDMDGIYRALDF